ncbi:MAG: two-component regulator propeller domain-containing protein, partial [Bacteroidota bacterium]
LSCFDGIQFVNYNRASGTIRNNEVCIIYEDQAGNIWFSSEGYGVYRYNGDSFANFSREQGLGVGAVQAIFEDQDGRIWVGGGGGLYRYDGASFISVTKDGPWR